MADLFRYAAFISYSSRDARFAQHLHRALERYGVPASLGAFDLIGGGKKNRVYPVFRDREELSAGALGDRIEAALKASAALIVVCSPHAAASPWVEQEIQRFKALGRRDRIFAILADSAPLTDEAGGDATATSFPAAFRGDTLTDSDAMEPLAADARQGKDGFRNAWLKIVAGLIGVTPGQLIDRDLKRRRVRRLQAIAGAGVAAIALAIGAAALDARNWRTDLTQLADGLVREGQSAQAAAWALGGAVPPGALLVLRDNAADDLLRQTGAVAVRAELGSILPASMSADGGVLFFQRADEGGTAATLDLETGKKSELGALGPLMRHALSADGATLLIHRDDAAQTGARISVRSGAKAELGALGPLSNFALSADGGSAAFFPATRDATAWVLAFASGERSDLGRLRVFNPAAAGSTLLIRRDDPTESWAVVDLATVTIRELGDFGSFQSFTRSGNGDVLFLLSADQDHTIIAVDLQTGARTELALGPLRSFQVSADGAVLAFQRDDPGRTLAVSDLRSGRTTELGAHANVESLVLAPDGRFLVRRHTQVARTSVLVDVETGAQTDLGPVWTVAFSKDSAKLVVLRDTPAGAAAVHALGAGEVIELGALGAIGNLFVGAGGATLAAHRRDGSGVVFDLSRRIDVSLSGARLAGAVCAASAHALRPPAAPDANVQADARVHAILRGRPRSPCDWRGLASILPRADQGDGWFEGPRQWLRLIHVRHFGGEDWPCAQTTSQASPETRAARADMCARFARAGAALPAPSKTAP